MKRRPAAPDLSWSPGEGVEEYRVTVRNEDTGAARVIYRGPRPGCRLPANLRLSPDQLSFLVEARDEGASETTFRQLHPFTGIDRLGEDWTLESPDLLTTEAVHGAKAYRLVVRNALSADHLVDFCRAGPRFRLPPGQLEEGSSEWRITALVDGEWTDTAWAPVAKDRIDAAIARAASDLPKGAATGEQALVSDAPMRPGRVAIVTPSAVAPSRLLTVVELTADPVFASRPDPATVISEQWVNRDGDGAVQRMLSLIEAEGLRAVVLVDVLAGAVLGFETLKRFVAEFQARGHVPELYLRPQPWMKIDPSLAPGADVNSILTAACSRFHDLTGRAPRLVRFGMGYSAFPALAAARALGIAGVVATPEDLQTLPSWMRGRITPFAALDGLVILPVTRMVSTPAHVRDRRVGHALSSHDPLIATDADGLAARSAATPAGFMLARLDPMTLLDRRVVRSAEQADAWNRSVRQTLPGWAQGGLSRSELGFNVADRPSEIARGLATTFLSGLAGAGLAAFDPERDLSPEGLAALAAPRSHDPLIEQRRGPRRFRDSAVRRYTNAYRLALQVAQS